MAVLTALLHVTLDGVLQAPGRADEDPRGGFAFGGWAASRGDAIARVPGGLNPALGLLFGRRTYEDFHGFWPAQPGNPFTALLDAAPKYVASRAYEGSLPWRNSTLLKGDAVQTVSDLKRASDRDLLILGSGALVRALAAHGLIDVFTLLIHPLVLGSGQRLFAEGGPTAHLTLVEAISTESGVIIAIYRPNAASSGPGIIGA